MEKTPENKRNTIGALMLIRKTAEKTQNIQEIINEIDLNILINDMDTQEKLRENPEFLKEFLKVWEKKENGNKTI